MSNATPRIQTLRQNLSLVRGRESREHRIHIQLGNLPRTALPSDIRRLVARSKLQGVSDVALDYHRLHPTGKAFITLTHPDFLRQNMAALQRATLATIPVLSQSSRPPVFPPSRTRGTRGRAEASDRGVITGDGPQGGLLNPGKNVVMWGLPGKIEPWNVKEYLAHRHADIDQREIVKLAKDDSAFSLASRFLVRMPSVSEAHRLVRLMHMTYFDQEKWGTKYLIRARVVY